MLGSPFIQRCTQYRIQDIDLSTRQDRVIRRRCQVRPKLCHAQRFLTYYIDSWGRILAATGSIPLTPASPTSEPPVINPTKVNVSFLPSDGSSPLPVLISGEPETVDEERAKEILGLEDFEILVDIGMNGDGEARYWTCDFSYVRPNVWFLGEASSVY
jgi:hypothetical protein